MPFVIEDLVKCKDRNCDFSEFFKVAFTKTNNFLNFQTHKQQGSTAAVCLVRMENDEKVVYSANAGDA